jgi:hypothetical protein
MHERLADLFHVTAVESPFYPQSLHRNAFVAQNLAHALDVVGVPGDRCRRGTVVRRDLDPGRQERPDILSATADCRH